MNRETPHPACGLRGWSDPQSVESRNVTSPTGPGDEHFVAASSQLNDGLKSCRAVVSNYRSLLAGESAGEAEPVGRETANADEEPADQGKVVDALGLEPRTR